ncbi:hypothetical protein [Chryseobacterium gregarium]|uniref:hypothetical protein n=1 Tax=Chryseobacterium gregarium TaxID=456299 RepID=UPI00041CA11F|nr:hypothetical protein [Chryseobacterium gregarium]
MNGTDVILHQGHAAGWLQPVGLSRELLTGQAAAIPEGALTAASLICIYKGPGRQGRGLYIAYPAGF